MDLFKQVNFRPCALIGGQYVPIVNVLAMLDRIIDEGHRRYGEIDYTTSKRINAAMMTQEAKENPR